MTGTDNDIYNIYLISYTRLLATTPLNYHRLRCILQEVILITMKGYKVRPVSISIGSQAFKISEVYIAPIDDNMLLGLAFLNARNIKLLST